MPVKRRRERERRADLCTNRRILYKLLTGHDFAILDHALGVQENRADHAQLEALRSLWAEVWPDVREQIIEWHSCGTAPLELVGIPRPARPGSRPWGWWAFDAARPAVRMTFPVGFAVIQADGREETPS